MEARFATVARGLAVCAVGCVVLVSFIPMWFTHPLADDFVRWHEGASDGWLSVAVRSYQEWSGRWAAAALDGALLHRLQGHRYGAVMALLSLVQLGACFAFVRLVLQHTVSRRLSWGLAFCLFALQWASLPAPGETVYWFSGGIQYQLSPTLAVILIWLAACFNPSRPLPRWLWIGTLSAMTLLITGLHELTGLMLCVVLAMAAAISRRMGKLEACPTRCMGSDKFSLWCWLLAVATIGVAACLLAPGNVERAAHFPEGRDPLKAVGVTAKFIFRDLSVWIADAKLLSASLFLFLSPWFARLRPVWLSWDVPWIQLVPLTGLAFVGCGAAVHGFAAGSSPPGRADNMLYCVFLMAWLITLLAATRWPENWIVRREKPASFLQTAALASLGLALLATGNTNIALRDLGKWTVRWHAAIEERDRLAASSAPGSALVVPAPPPMPHLFFQSDIQTDASDWRNVAYAKVHGLASVRIETELERFQRAAAAEAMRR